MNAGPSGSLRHAVLLMGFNRPDTTRVVLQRILAAAPPRLYVAIDGPRPASPTDAERVREVQAVVDEAIDRSTTVTRFRERNLGCAAAVVDAINWFFETESAGIVLEDDVVPSPSFFPFADEMLARYAGDERIWMVSGYNHLGRWQDDRGSYLFADGGVWGWATWKNRWARHDPALANDEGSVAHRIRRDVGRGYWRLLHRGLDRVRAGTVDTWDYQWAFSRLRHGGLAVVPTRCLVTNIGSGPGATHTAESLDPRLHAPAYDIEPPYRPIGPIERDRRYLKAVARREARNAVSIRLRAWRRRARTLLAGAPRIHQGDVG